MKQKWFEWLLVALTCFFLGASLCSCTYQEEIVEIEQGVCVFGPCEVSIYPDPAGQPNAYLDDNGYYHIEYFGPKYFGLKAQYSYLKGMYAPGSIPTIKTEWDSNFWYTNLGGVILWSNLYNPLGSDYTMNFSMALASETRQITVSLNEVPEIYNITGQYIREGSKGPMQTSGSGVDFWGKKMFTLMPEMVGDTIQITANTVFAYDSGKSEEFFNEINLIIE